MKTFLMGDPSLGRKSRLSLLLLLTVLFLVSCNSGEQVAGGSSSTETGNPINLTGRVVGNSNTPVSGVVVTLANLGISDTTDSQGLYSIQRNPSAKRAAKSSDQGVLDTLIFKQSGQEVTTLNVTKLVYSFPDIKIVQRDIAGNLLSSPVQISRVEGVLSGSGIPASHPLVAQFFYNKLSSDYSGFIYSPASDTLQSYSVYIKVFDTAGHLTGHSPTVPFNSNAGDITIPIFNPGNAIPKANAGKDTTAHLNQLFALHGTAVDSFGTIAKWEWDIGGMGVFKKTSTGDTTFLVSPQSPRSFICVLRVTDNNGTPSPTDTVVLRIDSVPPSPPIVMLNPSNLTTTSKRPIWVWSSGGGGSGTYRIKLDDPNLGVGATQTTTLSFTPASDLSYGSHTLYVQEMDSDENWSLTSSARVVVANPSVQTLIVAVNGSSSFKTANGGASWTPLNIDSGIHLYASYFLDGNMGWAVGAEQSTYATVIKTTDGGISWIKTFSGSPNYVLTSVCFLDANTGWSIGPGKLLKTINGGEGWTEQSGVSGARSVYFANANTGWAAGSGGAIFKTTNGGTTWTKQGAGNTLNSVFFVNPSSGWIAGVNGTLLKTVDAGINWMAQASGTTNDLNSVYFFDANTGWAVGSGGTLLKTINGGATWTVQSSGTTNSLNGIYFLDANTGWAVGSGGTLLKTINGGATWMMQAIGTTSDLYSITPIP